MSSGRAEYIRNILKITDSTLYSENRNVTIVSNSGSDQDSDPDVYCVDEIIDTKNFNKNSLLLFGYFYLNQYKNDFSMMILYLQMEKREELEIKPQTWS